MAPERKRFEVRAKSTVKSIRSGVAEVVPLIQDCLESALEPDSERKRIVLEVDLSVTEGEEVVVENVSVAQDDDDRSEDAAALRRGPTSAKFPEHVRNCFVQTLYVAEFDFTDVAPGRYTTRYPMAYSGLRKAPKSKVQNFGSRIDSR